MNSTGFCSLFSETTYPIDSLLFDKDCFAAEGYCESALIARTLLYSLTILMIGSLLGASITTRRVTYEIVVKPEITVVETEKKTEPDVDGVYDEVYVNGEWESCSDSTTSSETDSTTSSEPETESDNEPEIKVEQLRRSARLEAKRKRDAALERIEKRLRIDMFD
jgi:hypothetical protein